MSDHITLGKHVVRDTLIQQVTQAARGDTEQRVRTVISRAMWRLWCFAVGDDPDCEPTEWKNDFSMRRVYGSETIIVESDAYFSYSFLRPELESGFDVA